MYFIPNTLNASFLKLYARHGRSLAVYQQIVQVQFSICYVVDVRRLGRFLRMGRCWAVGRAIPHMVERALGT